MENVEIFKSPEFGEVRTLMVNNEPWFVGKDVAEALGYSNASKAVMVHVDDEDKRMMILPNSQNGNSVGKCYVINESGLYGLIFNSKLPGAKKFKRWVTSEVLPTIRRTGGYIADDEQFLRFYAPTADEPTMAFIRAQMEIARGLCRKRWRWRQNGAVFHFDRGCTEGDHESFQGKSQMQRQTDERTE